MKIIEFGAKWCGPCKSMKSVFAKFEKAADVQLERKDLDVEADYDLSEKLGVRAIPTVVWLSDAGKELERVAGVATLAELEAAHRRAEMSSIGEYMQVAAKEARRLNKKEASKKDKGLRKVLKIAKEPISLETPIGEEEDSHLGDFIEDKASPSDAVAEQTRKVLATLTPREEKVLRMRFGIGEKGESASKKDKGPKTKKARS